MKRVFTSVVAIALLLLFSAQGSAGGARVAARSVQSRVSPPVPRFTIAPMVQPHRGHSFDRWSGRLHQSFPYHSHAPYYRYYPAPVLIIAPNHHYPYYYSYYAPATVLLSSPFYCFSHHEGFVSRIGFIDHVGGTHKIPLDTVASLCADGSESCVIE